MKCMRDRAEWMNKATIPILELLAESDLALPGGTIVVNLNRKLSDSPGRATVFRALDPLQEQGLIEPLESKNTHYVITDRGRAYLNSEDIPGTHD